jgi:hypothetical protein
LAKEWRTDRYLRRLEAQLIVADRESLLVLSGDGDVIEPDDGVVAIGSGAPYATAAAKALVEHTDLDARGIVEAAMRIAADICIFTNDHFTVEAIVTDVDESDDEPDRHETVDELEIKEAPRSTDADDDDDDDDDEESDATIEHDTIDEDDEREEHS